MMKRALRKILLGAAGGLAACSISMIEAADLKSATITEAVRKVTLRSDAGSSRDARVGDLVSGSAALTTGRRSRAEVEFPDRTLLRIGSNSIFSLAGGSREIELREGSVLIQTAPGAGGVNVRSGSVAAAITGSMGLFSVATPDDRDAAERGERIVKFISVHGKMRLELGDKIYDLQPFQMIFLSVDRDGNPIGEPTIVTIDGQKLVDTSKLINGFANDERVDQGEILAQLGVQGTEKSENEWTVVSTAVNDKIPGLPQRNTIGLNALIRPFLPPPPAPPVINRPPAPSSTQKPPTPVAPPPPPQTPPKTNTGTTGGDTYPDTYPDTGVISPGAGNVSP